MILSKMVGSALSAMPLSDASSAAACSSPVLSAPWPVNMAEVTKRGCRGCRSVGLGLGRLTHWVGRAAARTAEAARDVNAAEATLRICGPEWRGGTQTVSGRGGRGRVLLHAVLISCSPCLSRGSAGQFADAAGGYNRKCRFLQVMKVHTKARALAGPTKGGGEPISRPKMSRPGTPRDAGHSKQVRNKKITKPRPSATCRVHVSRFVRQFGAWPRAGGRVRRARPLA